MDDALVIVSVITTIGGLFGLWMINQNWFRRLKAKLDYEKDMAKLKHKYGITKASLKTPQAEGKLEGIASLVPMLTKLSGNQIKALADKFLNPEDFEEGEEGDIISTLINEISPDLIKGFLEGQTNKSQTQTRQDNY